MASYNLKGTSFKFRYTYECITYILVYSLVSQF